MIGCDVAEPVEPPQRQLGQHAALARHGRGQHHVVDGDPVGGDEQQVIAVRVDLADLTGVNQLHLALLWIVAVRRGWQAYYRGPAYDQVTWLEPMQAVG